MPAGVEDHPVGRGASIGYVLRKDFWHGIVKDLEEKLVCVDDGHPTSLVAMPPKGIRVDGKLLVLSRLGE